MKSNKHNKKSKNTNKNSINNNNNSHNNITTTNAATAASTPRDSTPKPVAHLSHQHREKLNGLVYRLLQMRYDASANGKQEWQQYIELLDILKRIMDLEKPLQRLTVGKMLNDTRIAAIDAFNDWATANGVATDCLQVKEFPGYQLGLQATRDVQEGELVLTIPRKLIFSIDHLLKDRTISNAGSMANMNLAYALMLEKMKGSSSFWQPYIDVLPEKFSTVLYFSADDMAELRGTSAFSNALRHCVNVARQYAYIYKCTHMGHPPKAKHLNEDTDADADFKGQFCYELYRWAVSTVMTRENIIPGPALEADGTGELKLEGAEQEPLSPPATRMVVALIPFWDMANHKSGSIRSFYNEEEQVMRSIAQENVSLGEQFFIYYGDRTNAEFLVHNGFIDAENRKDSVSIKLGLSQSDPLFEQRNWLLKELDISRSGEFQVLPSPDFISAKLLAFVRVFKMNGEQLTHWQQSKQRIGDLLHFDCALETDLELQTWQYLSTRFMLLLRAFPQTLAESEALLAKLNDDKNNLNQSHKSHHHKPQHAYASSRKELVLHYRILEQRILQAAYENAKERCKN